ncbi:hypothetical protein SLA2020_309980 [Shorea laevis]
MTVSITAAIQTVNYCVSEHPLIVNFRWNHTQSWGSTWSFLFTAIAAYIVAAISLHITLSVLLYIQAP